ncbi:Ferric reductase-like transmembrane component [Purpureocillium lavendulum]|uniref:Ferric reductase-like transmembrane component n=1 Tax=Purpureocillium lavendulum TaxID=1247861 RepID=A0AB34FV88_9HYPO|nr:Ferric reductase-like transmembrane component [Purpureocillium lavendulum]
MGFDFFGSASRKRKAYWKRDLATSRALIALGKDTEAYALADSVFKQAGEHGLESLRREARRIKSKCAKGRKIRSVSIRSFPGLPSVGHAGLVSLYVAINIIVTFTNIDNKNLGMITNIAARTAWLAVANLIVLIVLALKNTPLAFLTAWSYERLNVLHQVAGYTTIIHVIIHASCYSAYFVQDGRSERLLAVGEIYGMVAGLSFVIIGFAGAVLRRWWYELFYYVHVSFWALGIVMVGFHQPEFGKKVIVMTLVAAGLWVMDRLIRLTRLALYSVNNSVTLTPLPNGATRVTLVKPPACAVSGKHCFLWLPKIRTCETHPFTIAATDPVEFVVTSHDGFTRDLHRYAVSHPGVTLRASVEGTYGKIPDPAAYDTVVLVAGGSGASFTFGMALNMLRKLQAEDIKNIVFVWVVRHHEYLEWYTDHLITLGSESRVDTKLFVTRKSLSQPTSPLATSPATEIGIKEISELAMSHAGRLHKSAPKVQSQSSTNSLRSEKSQRSDTNDAPMRISGIPILYERPDVSAIIHQAIDGTPAQKHALVLGCGPHGLMKQVRNTTAECIRTKGPSVELHCEQFGW